MQKKKFKVTPLERAWILYDVGNSAFVLMIATLVPIFFNALAEAGGVSKVNYLAYWGYASSVVTVITAVLGPILGTLADTKNFKKPIFMLCLFVGVLGCCAMGAARTWLPFLVVFIVAKIGFSGSLVFYDSMLGDVTTPERMDMVSSRGYAWGYIGSCVPFVVCLALVLGSSAIGMSQMTALTIALFITAAWWLVTTLPLLRRYRQVNYVEVEQHAIRQSFVRIGHTLKHLREDKQVFWFLLAFFCYIDGVYTIIDMATAYGTALGLDTTGLLLALLVTQIVAFPSALIFGRLSAKYPSSQLIPVCIAAYTGIAVFAFFLTQQGKGNGADILTLAVRVDHAVLGKRCTVGFHCVGGSIAVVGSIVRLAQFISYFCQQAPRVGQICRSHALARIHHCLHGGDARLAPFAVVHAV